MDGYEWRLEVKYSPNQPRVPAGQPGGGRWTSGGGISQIPYRPDPNVVRQAEWLFDDSIEKYAEYFGLTKERAEKWLFDQFRDDLENPIAIRRSVYSTIQILEDGHFKTQFEVGNSGGTYDPQRRLQAEENGLGYPQRYPEKPGDRPIYGFVSTPENGASDYGDVEWVLKESVKDRSTVTVGDSLYKFEGHAMVGEPYRNPGKGCIEGRAWDYLEKGIGDLPITYLEVQIHGGVRLNDVAKIRIFTKKMWINDYDERHVLDIQKKAAEHGIEVEVIREED